MKPNSNFLGRLLLAGLVTLCVAEVFADNEPDLIQILNSDASIPDKCETCQKLRLVGTSNCVPAVAALLVQAPTAHAARYALEGIPCPEAVAALRQAAAKTSGLIKAGLIDSLGWRRDTAAVPLLTESLTDAEPAVATAAASALGRVGGQEAITALTAAQEEVPPAVRSAVLDGLARCADRLLSEGDARGAASVYRPLSGPKTPDNIRVAAWRGLVRADTAGRAQLVTQALMGEDGPLRRAALKVLREVNDAAVVDACLQHWQNLGAEAQLAVLDARVQLGGDVLPTVRTAAQSPHLSVRVAAWQALADSGDPTAIPALAKAAAAGEPAEREAARDSLTRLRGAGIERALLGGVAAADPNEKVELLRALGERGDNNACPVLLENAGTGPDPVRFAALESLGKLADPNTVGPLVTLAANAKSDEQRERVLNALYSVCQASRDKEQTTAVVLGVMKPLPAAERGPLLPVLSELATPAALDTVLGATRAPDAELVKQAVGVLAQWPNAAPAPRLLELADTVTDPGLQVLALRGCITVAGQEPDYPKRLATLQKVLAVAKRPEEKKQALGQIGQVPTRAALDSAMTYLSDPELANEAGLAAVTIAEKLAGTDRALARETAAKVLAQCQTPQIVKRAWAIAGKPAGSGPFIQDWLVCGPYRQPGITGAMALFDIPFGPEKANATVSWKPLPRSKFAELASFFPDQLNCVAYLKTRIISPRDCDAALLLGSDDGVKAWLNGAVVHSNNVDRGLVVDQDMAPIRLNKGTNDLMLKITQGGGGWGACARIVGPDGRPIPGVKVQLDR